MGQFQEAVDFVLANEGGYVESSNDPGGASNFGISLRFLRGVGADLLRKIGVFEPVDEDTIKNLTQDQAVRLYRFCFWDMAHFDKIINQQVTNYIFDMVIQHGMGQAIKLAQRAICCAQKVRGFVKDDGVMGSQTLSGINYAGLMLVPPLVAMRDGFVRMLVRENPKMEGFLDGWLNRCYRV